jgi:hypothetical protein
MSNKHLKTAAKLEQLKQQGEIIGKVKGFDKILALLNKDRQRLTTQKYYTKYSNLINALEIK